jgi:PadR family transcriptional regulator PadR
LKSKRTNPDFVNGVPELLIFTTLARRPMHGYELVQSLRQAAGDALSCGEGSVYPILHRLEADKLLASKTQSVSGRDRVVYHVTAAGRKRLAERTAAWRRVAEVVASALQGGSHVPVELA